MDLNELNNQENLPLKLYYYLVGRGIRGNLVAIMQGLGTVLENINMSNGIGFMYRNNLYTAPLYKIIGWARNAEILRTDAGPEELNTQINNVFGDTVDNNDKQMLVSMILEFRKRQTGNGSHDSNPTDIDKNFARIGYEIIHPPPVPVAGGKKNRTNRRSKKYRKSRKSRKSRKYKR